MSTACQAPVLQPVLKPMPGAIGLRFEATPQIENRWKYPQADVERLRALLCTGAVARPDPVRSSLYEVEDHTSVFYIHVSPVTQHVMLLAMWPLR